MVFAEGLSVPEGPVVLEDGSWLVGEMGEDRGCVTHISSDGKSIFLRHNTFDLQGARKDELTPHLFSSVGFLDSTWWHRTYFIYGTNFNAGWGGWWRMGNRVPAGRLLVVHDDSVYGFGRSFYPHGNSGQWQIGEEYLYPIVA